MSEPTSVNIGLVVPLTGDLPGSWGTAAVNLNMNALDGILGGVQTISLSAASTFALTTNTATLTPSAGPVQSQNACLIFSGTLTGNNTVQFTVPGRYVVHNKCTVGNFYLQLSPSAGVGNAIGAPPGEKITVFYDGTNMDYVDLGRVGTAFDLHGATSIPGWIATACTVPPYLLKDGSTYSTSTYPTLGAMLGSTFGGNGISTFGVPDERNRMRVPVDTNTNGGFTNRITQAVAGINGTTMGAAGGDQNLAAHTHAASVTDPTHNHNVWSTNTGTGIGLGQPSAASIQGNTTNSGSYLNAPASGSQMIQNHTTGVTVSNATTGSGAGANVQPSIVSFLALIRAA